MFKVPEKYRVESSYKDGNNGAFYINSPKLRHPMFAIASDGYGWEHVSVQMQGRMRLKRCPYWEEMCFIKDLFWDEEDTVVQIHPPKSEYVNIHPYVLHLWRPKDTNLELPDNMMV